MTEHVRMQDFPSASVEVIEPREIKEFASAAGYQVSFHVVSAPNAPERSTTCLGRHVDSRVMFLFTRHRALGMTLLISHHVYT
jgi:hypothetical protein